MPAENYVLLGKFTRPHSIKGEIRLDYYADSPKLLDQALFLKSGSAPLRPIRLESWRIWNGQPIVRLPGVADRNAAELLRGQELYLARADLPRLTEDEAYISDLIGLPVFAENRQLGNLEQVSFPGGQELWHIYTPQGDEILVPAVPGFVQSIDLDRGITISPPPGLLELYLPKS